MFRKMNVLLLVMFFSFCFHIGVSAEIYLDEETQKVWWTGADAASLNRKALVDFTGGVGNPAISTWTKKAAYTNLNTGPIQQGAGHYVDPMTGLDVKGLNQVYFDGPPGTGTQLGTNIGAYGYDRSQPVVIGKAPQKGANYVYAFRNYSGGGTITAELYDARTSESYGATGVPRQVGTGTQMYSRNGSSVTILPGADLSYYWVVGVDHLDNPANIVSFKVSADNPQGVSTTPVKSLLGQVSGNPVEDFRNMMPWNSEMASGAGIGSPITGSVTGTSKLVIADYGSSNIYVYNFNRGTGVTTLLNRLSEATTVPSGFTGYVGGSSDFSPSGQYVYFTKGALAYYGPIYRWDYAAGVVELVPGQSPASRGSGYVQTAPNGRMYVNRGYPDYLPGFGEIANPDSALISGVGYVQDKYTFPISSTSMDGLATETIGVYVYDSGDAPASYETAVLTQGNTGITYAKHMYDYEVKLGTTNGYLLGNTRNTTNTSPYDDGVTFLKDANNQNFLKVGKPTSFTVNVSKPGYISVWLDLDQDGTWQSVNDKIVSSQLITTTGTNQQINITIPYDYVSTTSGSTWFRARYSTYQADVVNSAGWARDGEVEDYAVLIEKEDVTLTKTSPTGEYTPEQTVLYNVSIENNGEIPATGMSIQDLLSSVQALDSSAANSAAFSSWTITAKNGAGTNIPSGGTVGGTSAGTFSSNTDLNTTVTIAAGDTLTYTITATVSEDIVGPIVNTANLDLNVVTSDSSRVIQTAESTLTAALPSLEISKTSSTTTYSPTGTIVYVLDIENTGTGIASDISIVDTLSSITTELANGNPGAAFSSWTISAVGTGTETTTGTYSDNTDLNTTIDIAVGGRVTYTITGTVVNNAIGTISNYATVDGTNTLTVDHTSVAGSASGTKTSATTTYAPSGVIIYTLTVNNTGSGFALNVPVADSISTITTNLVGGSTGVAFLPGWTISAVVNGIDTTSGTFVNGANLDTTVNIAPGGSVVYTITGTVVENAVGSITNVATVDNVATDSVTHIAETGTVSATKTSDTTTYFPTGTITYTLTVSNTGTGFALNVPVIDSISAITTDLSGGGTGAAFQTNWTISAATTGTGTTNGSFSNGADLDTIVNIAPGGSVIYTITGTVVSNAVGTISNSATVNNVPTEIVTHVSTGGVVNGTKTSGTTTYIPNGTIIYTLTIANTGSGFAQAVSVVDLIGAITTELADDSISNAFQPGWTITASTTGTGTTSGSFADGANLNTSVNIAPSGSVTYTITGTVASTAIGAITNTAVIEAIPLPSVTHISEVDTVSATKTSSTTTYTPGGTITYTLTINNTGNGFASNISVVDAIDSITTSLAGGTSGAAFQSGWLISAATTGIGTTSGSFDDGNNLNTTVNIAPGGSVVYTITGTVVSNALGSISNSATVEGTPTLPVSHNSEPGTVSATKTSNTTTYVPNGTIIYTLTINNTGTGFAEAVSVVDLIDGITTNLASGTVGGAFQAGWTISAAVTGTGTTSGEFNNGQNLSTSVDIAPGGSVVYTITGTVVPTAIGLISNNATVNGIATEVVTHTSEVAPVVGVKTSNTTTYVPNGTIVYVLTITNTGNSYAQNIPVVDNIGTRGTQLVGGDNGPAFTPDWTITATTTGTGTDSGDFADNNDLNTIVTIAPGGSVTYTITTTVVYNAVGTITNLATVNGVSLPTIVHTPTSGEVSATKTSNTTIYAPSGSIIYTLTIQNTGSGYALSIPVIDNIGGITTDFFDGSSGLAFQPGWTISAAVTGAGTTSGTVADGQNINTTIDIAYGGSVTYTITGTVASTAVGPISNSATVNSVAVGPVTHFSEPGVVSATKTSSTATYEPNGTIIYTLTINNTGDGYAVDIPIVDNISAILTDLANDATGPAFQAGWTISAATTGTGTTSGTFADGSNLDTTVDIAPDGSVTYTITGTVVDNAIGTVSNSASVNSIAIGPVTHTAIAGVVDATKTSSTTTYEPDGTIIYTLTVNNTGNGFAVDIPIEDDIGGIQTTLVGGGTGLAFQPGWTITAATAGTGTTSGSFTNGASLDTTATIAPGGSVTYTITGIVVSNAIGVISNSAIVDGLTIGPVTHTAVAGVIDATKTSGTATYQPNGTIIYTLEITNEGNGFAVNIPVVDNISAIQVNLAGGNTGAAFLPGWTITASTTGAGTSSGIFAHGANLDTVVTIAPGGSVTYTITGTVVNTAVGSITNSAIVDGIPVAPVIHTSVAGVIDATKTSGTTIYEPNGTIVYTLAITNEGNGFALAVPVIDNIGTVQTTLVGGGTGNAFQSGWTITATPTGIGTTNGSFSNGANLNTTVDIAPGGSVTYTITGTVVGNAIGTISNSATVDGTTVGPVTHTAAVGVIDATKTSGTTIYEPNGTIVYTLTINNTGNGFAVDIPVEDNISGIQTDLVGGNTGAAFQPNWTITASPSGTGTTTGTFADGANLNTAVTIAPGGSVAYTITGTVVYNAIGTISNLATVDNIPVTPVSHTAVAGVVNGMKTSGTTHYAPNGTIVYTLEITNEGNGFAVDIPILDNIGTIQTTLVGGGTGTAFQSGWTITASMTGTGTTSGTYANGANLDTTVNIAPGGSVTYVITGTVVNNAVGSIINAATVDGVSVGPVTHTAVAGTVNATKTSGTMTYEPNGNISYTLTISNTGDGFATDVTVVDLIDTIQTTLVGGPTGAAFQAGWTISAAVTGIGTTSGSFTNGANLNTTVNIAPGGSVTYTISGTVVATAIGSISNSATVDSVPVGPVTHTAVAGVVDATKTSTTTTYYEPSGEIVYVLTINNTGNGFLVNIPVVDSISGINTDLADTTVGAAFQPGWTISASTTGTGTTSGSFATGDDLDTFVTIAPGGSVTYTITGTVVINAVGIISNSAAVNSLTVGPVTHIAATGTVTATKISGTTTYEPNGSIVYTVTINNTGAGFVVDVPVVDNIGTIQTTLVGGGTGNAFQPGWTIGASTTGIGTTSGSFIDGDDLNTTVTIAPGGSVTYTITGTVVSNAVGSISNSTIVDGTAIGPITHTAVAGVIDATKTSNTTTYAPNGTIIYTLEITNEGDGFAVDIPVEDNIGAIQTTLVGGGTGNAFESGWAISASTTGTGTTSGSFANGANLNTTVTIAPGGSVTYTITGTVVSNAVGSISNSTIVNGVTIGPITHIAVAGVIDATKTSGTMTYAPNGTIIYTLMITNEGDGFVESIPVVDNIGAIQTTLVGGGTGFAFQPGWTISASTAGTGTTSGSFANGANLNTTVTIAPGGSVTYTITGTVVSNAVGTISNSAVVDSIAIPSVTHTAVAGVISTTKTSNTTTYAPNGTIIYTLEIHNDGDGFAESIPVIDNIGAIQTTLVGGGTGNAFLPGWTISASTDGTGTTSGSFANGANLNTTVTIAPGGSVTYTITGTVVSNAIGTISNSAMVNGIAVPPVNHTAIAGVVSATKTSGTTTYAPNGTIIYTLEISNDGDGFAESIPVIDNIGAIQTTLVGGGTGNAFLPGWTITASTTGTGTTSGSYASGANLNTTVTIAPGGSVTYTIIGTVVSNAVGIISNSATVNSITVGPVSHTVETGTISAVKTSGTATYSPNGSIIYTLTIENTGNGFAESIPVIDNISAIQTTLVGGGTGSAFLPGWTITASTTGTGTTSGSFATGADLDTTVTIAPSGSVTYTITGTVVATAIGQIDNFATVNNITTNTVSHISAASEVSATKTSGTTIYTPNGNIIYTLTIENTGTGFAQSVPVVDAISLIQTTLVGGGTGNAFQPNWTITASTTGTGTTSGSFATGADLDTTINIAPGGSVTYTITGAVVATAVGQINNFATVNNIPTNTVTHTSETGTISAVKSSSTTTYAPNGSITYTLEIENTGSGFIISVPVVDMIGNIQTTLVGGATGNAFQPGWTISATTTGTGTTSGSFATGSNLNTTVNIAPGGSVTYTITGTTNAMAVGQIDNLATVDNTPTNVVSHTSATGVVSATKASGTTTYTPNGNIIYTLTIENTGDGFAESIPVIDNIGAIQTTLVGGGTGAAFQAGWTISAATTGTGTTSGTVVNGSNINTTVNIAPAGSVVYTITGVVVNNAVGTISNSATVDSIAIGPVNHTAEAGVVSATKTSSTTTYAPNGSIVYTITINNTGSGFAVSVPVVDSMSAITTTLVGGGTGAAFQANWTISASITGTGTTSGSFANGADLNTTINIAPGGSVTYTITGIVVGNAVGQISNSSTINGVATTSVTHTSLAGVVSATKTSGTTTYSPNGTIIYTLTIVNTGSGFAQNIPVIDQIGSSTTVLASGSTGNAFQPGWIITASTTGIGTTSGSYSNGANLNTTVNVAPGGSVTYTITSTVVNNAVGSITNSATVDGIPTGSVTHTTNAAIITGTQTSTTTTYAPGGTIDYTIIVKNTGSGFAVDVPVSNLLSSITTNISGGGTGPAFTSWTISAATTGTGTMAGTYGNNINLNANATIAPGGTVTYTIIATTATNTLGPIINLATINGIETEPVTHTQVTGLLVLTKSVTTSQTTAGSAVGYKIIISNSTGVATSNLYIYDYPPNNFSYVNQSASQTHSDDTTSAVNVTVNGSTLVFGPLTVKSGEDLEINYALKVSAVVSPGRYENRAVAQNSSHVIVTNEGRATVNVFADTFVSAATIIGKVFEDFNKDGFQSSATATKVSLEQLDTANFISESAAIIYYNADGEEISQKKISDAELKASKILLADHLEGKSGLAKTDDKNKLKFKVEISKPQAGANFILTTSEGMKLVVSGETLDDSTSRGDYSRKLTSQEFNIIREITQENGRYFFEMTITNTGLQEEGLPGVRLITPEGLTIYTDQFGRFHIPTRIVENSLGLNYVIKVDEQSLPTGMKVVTENPRSKLITSYGLNEFNFGVRYESVETGGRKDEEK